MKKNIEILPVDSDKMKPGLVGEKDEISEEEFEEDYMFFKIKWRKKEDDENTKKVDKLLISRLRFLSILAFLGFKRYQVQNEFIYVHCHSNIIEEVDILQMVHQFMLHMQKLPFRVEYKDAVILRDQILETLLSTQETLFKEKVLCHLPLIKKEDVNEDTRTESFFYYQNKYVRVTHAAIELRDYDELKEKYVWKGSILDRKIEHRELAENQDKNIWAQFIFNICKQDNERIDSMMHVIGYIMHSYFSGKLKTINFTDSTVSSEDNGRTGKGLIMDGITNMLNRNPKDSGGAVVHIDGKRVKKDDPNMYQDCGADTTVVHLNDPKGWHDVRQHYVEMEKGISVNKKYALPYRVMVKIVITSNKTLAIKGGSSKGRFMVCDISDHYSDNYTPEDEFGLWFFRDFDEEHWLMFDTFMLHCAMFYLKEGLVAYRNINLQKRMMHDQLGEDFVNFMKDFPNQLLEPAWEGEYGIIENRQYAKKDLYQIFIDKTGNDTRKYKQRRFTQNLREYKSYSAAWKSDVSDIDGQYSQERRSNGEDLIWFVKAGKKEEE